MSMIDRIKNICLTPNTEWRAIEQESATPGGLLTGYALPLAAVAAIAGFIGGSIVGMNTFLGGYVRTPVTWGLVAAIWGVISALVGAVICAVVVNALAPTFGGQQDSGRAFKVAVYSFTPAWVLGVLQVVPGLGLLGGLVGGLYAIYLLYLGLPVLMKAPAEKAIGYTAVTVVCVIVASIVLGAVGAVAGLGTAAATGVFSNPSSSSSSSEVQFDKNSPLGKLQEFGKAIEESGKKMEAAQKSGDANAQANAAMETLGALLGGGKRVDPLSIDQMKAFVPQTFGGLSMQGAPTVEKTGFGGLMVSRAEARYGDGADKNVTLEIVDSGGASGLMGLAGWIGVQGSREDANGSERTEKVGGRIVHEKRSKDGDDEFGIVLGDRFMVSAKSGDMDADQLKAAVNGLDLRRIEGMKDAGVQKP
jgi:hypothetical protein